MGKLKLFLLTGLLCLANKPLTLIGSWEYVGGIYNGKAESNSKDYSLRRHYNAANFDAYLLEPKQPPYKYQSGGYVMQGDSCLETETFSAQPSKLTGKTIRYHYLIVKDTLKLSGTLPNGNMVEEHWKKIN